jgi:predicted nucleic acid-binding protein
MSDWIVDASVVIKWFIPEHLSTEARLWRKGRGALHAPSLLDAELANILWKKIVRGELTRSQGDRILARLPRLLITRHSDATLLASAFDIACDTQRTVYDSLYVALAEQVGGRMVTADEKLFNALRPTRWTALLHWVGDAKTP